MKSLSEARQAKILTLLLSILSAGLLALLILPKIPQIRMITPIFLITAFQSFFLLSLAIDHVFIGEYYDPIWFGVLKDSHSSGHRPIFVIVRKNQ